MATDVKSCEVVLFCSPEMQPMAEKIVAADPKRIFLHTLKWKSFKDGFPDLFIENVKDIRNKDVAFLCGLGNPQVIFEQIAVLYSLPRYLVKSLKLVLPFFPTGTMERVDVEGQVATAMTLARLISAVPPTVHGPTRMMVYDIHALSIRFYFGDNIIPVFESAIPLLRNKLETLHDKEKVAIAFPDDGAFKRFKTFFPDYPIVICNKVREGAKRVVKIKEGEPADRHVVIVDDLVQTGGTLIECAKTLKLAKAKDISAFVTHAVFPLGSEMRFMRGLGDGYFDESSEAPFTHFWVTDSCRTTLIDRLEKGETIPPFELISLAEDLARSLIAV